MNKKELIQTAAEKAGLTQKETQAALDALLSTVTDTLSKGDKVVLTGFGTFERKHRDARTCRIPKTGENIEVAAAEVPSFKAGEALKKAVQG